MKLPLIGLGTWELRGEECSRIIKLALDLGYRHLDTAHNYENHKAVGEGIAHFDRSKLFVTSKLEVDSQVNRDDPETSVRTACERALTELGTDYLDLYLIHWPANGFPLELIFKTMEKLKKEGKVKHVGVSNYAIEHLEALRKAGSIPEYNQVEFHPYLNQKELLHYCKTHHIELVSYRSLGKGKLPKEEPLFSEIGAKYGKSGAQVILRWLIQQGIPVIPKASSQKHLEENLQIFDFTLTSVEMTQIGDLHKDKRYCKIDLNKSLL